ncbi:hypothetical protein D484_01075 [Staphylococcus aureus subsp. aureus SK1585]|nr:hypothetical protein D484_01075 [Staphylococcus aureus subsp. aureus SK1585]
MMKEKEFYTLKRAVTSIAFNLPVGTMFMYHDLNVRANVLCSTEIQQDVGRWFAHFVKYTPNLPFIVVGKKGSSLLYLKTAQNPMNHQNNWKGGNN